MKPLDIFKKTQKFVWAKLLLVGIKWAALIVLAALFALLIGATGNGILLVVLGITWLIIARVSTFLIDKYFGYLIKAGHVAVVAHAINDGQLVESENMVELAKEEVKSRFAASNVYFVINDLVSGAVRQLQNGINSIGNLFENIPVVKTLFSLLSMFVGIFLNYVDECCLGWVFINKEQGAFKSSLDAVILYFQNAKNMAKNSVKIIALIVAYNVICWTLCIIAIVAIPNQIVGIIVAAVLLAVFSTVRTSFIDSYVMISVMTTYGEYAKVSEVQFDLHDKLCKLSSKFKKLFEKAQAEGTIAV